MINWTKLPDLPEQPILRLPFGVSAPFAGIHNGVLIVAGGCNFPDKPVTEGGAKRYYSEIFVLLPEGWKEIDRLPRPSPTALRFPPRKVSFASEETTVILPWSRSPASPITPRKEVAVCALPSLPSPMDNLSAAFTGQEIYVAGEMRMDSPAIPSYASTSRISKGMGTTTGLPGAAPCTTGISGRRKSQRHTYLSSRRLPAHPKRRGTDRPTDVLVFDPATFTGNKETVLPRLRTERTVP